ncbi:MAG: hypothetical protein E6Q97_01090 [Desulfurellales bacterium]|nr:MAG: hypothetical protein E6Q97_01090 [Desulfurellales bacterium]
MKAQNEKNLTDNAWVERIGQLRQMVSDQYDTTQNTTPQQFVDWLVENADEEFDSADERILLRRAEESLEDAARQRVENEDELDAISDVIFYDWPNKWDHLAWVVSADVSEIVDWAETVEMAAE